MAAHGHTTDLGDDRMKLGGGARVVAVVALIIAAAGLALTVLGGSEGSAGQASHDYHQRFFYSYLVGFAFWLSLALGALFSVMVHYTTRAGWNVTVRRTAENIAASLPVFAILALPLLFSVVQNKGVLYPWAMPVREATHTEHAQHAENVAKGEEGAAAKADNKVPTAEENAREHAEQIERGTIDHEIAWKRHHWYSNPFFFARVIFYLVVWTLYARWYRRQSIVQDANGDPEITTRLQAAGPLGLIVLALSITFFAFDMLMSLDPRWYSTMFGVYYIAGCIVSGFGAVIIAVFLLQKAGYLRGSITTEHYHDLGKYLFAFTFFYGYIAFSQYMLLWYSSIPEEVEWYARHGASTLHPTRWSYVILAILFGKFAIPFLGLLSRHVKRNKHLLVFWAVWVLVFQFIDVYWVVMPQYGALRPSIADLGALLLVGGVFVAAVVMNMAGANLRSTHDPRLPEAMAFTNI